MEDRQDEEAGSWQYALPLRGTNDTGSKREETTSHPQVTTSHPQVLNLPLRGTNNTGSEAGSRLQGLPLRGINDTGSEAESSLQDLPLRGTINTGSKRKEATSHPHVFDLPLRGTSNTGSKRKKTSSQSHVLDLPLRGTNGTGMKREETISHPHMHNLPLRSTHTGGPKSEEPISQPQMHDLPLRDTDSTGSKSLLQGSNIAGSKRKFASDIQNETVAPAAGIKRHNSQGTSAPQLTWFDRGYRVLLRGITSPQAVPTYGVVDGNGNIEEGMVVERTLPSTSRGGGESEVEVTPAITLPSSEQFAIGPTYTSHVDGGREVDAAPATTFSGPVKQPAPTNTFSAAEQPATHPSTFHVDEGREADAATATSFSAPVEQPASTTTFSAALRQSATHPSTSHVDGSREADSTPVTTFSGPVKQPAPANTFPTPATAFSEPVKQPAVKQRGVKVRAVFALRLSRSDLPSTTRRGPCTGTSFPLPSGSIELHSTLTAANAEARRVAGLLLSSARSSAEKISALQKRFDQKLEDLKQGVGGEGDEAEGDPVNEDHGLRVTWGARSRRGHWHSVFYTGYGASDFRDSVLHIGYQFELCVVVLAVDAPATSSLFAPY